MNYKIEPPKFKVNINGVESVENEYTVRNLQLQVAKGNLSNVTVEGIEILPSGRMAKELDKIALSSELMMKLLEIQIREI